MISCIEFIPAYNELFQFLYAKGGMDALQDFWRTISAQYLTSLERLVQEKGIQGMVEYWGETLEEEAAGYELNADQKSLVLQIHSCPSIGLLNKKGLEKSPRYCAHCDALYRPIIERAGFSFAIEYLDREGGSCCLIITE